MLRSLLGRRCRRLLPSLRILLLSIVVTALFALAQPGGHVFAEGDCDPSEAVACIPLPPGRPAPAPGRGASASSAAASSVTVPLPVCPLQACCPPFASLPVALPAAPVVPAPPCCSDPYGPPIPAPLSGVAAGVPVPQPYPYLCPPFRDIYATINLGNAADVRALRTLSTAGLSAYWRQGALAQIQAQVTDLSLRGVYATASLRSITVRSTRVGPGGMTANVSTMEHWRYQERSLDDGALLVDADEWVANQYGLSFDGDTWTIRVNTATLIPGS